MLSDGLKKRVHALWNELGAPLNRGSSSSSGPIAARPDAGRVEPELARRAAAPVEHASGNRNMFDRIAPSYDRMNRLMTLGIDKGWRKKAVEMVKSAAHGSVLDLCAGTLDLSSAIEEAYPEARVVACDASERMLLLGRAKVTRVETVVGDALAMPFTDAEFNAVICGFGVRNLSDLRKGVREIRRVLKPGGVFVTLELFQPRGATSRFIHGAGLRYALPALGAAIANDREAYAYLAESMEGFVTREAYETLLTEEGFGAIVSNDLTLGMAALVRAEAK